MKHKKSLLASIEQHISYEKQLQKQLKEINQGQSRENRISFLELCASEIDILFASLKRLADLAKNDTGGSRVAGEFLLNLYNKRYSHFDLRDFGNLDHSYWCDAINVLKLDRLNHREIHEYLDDGENLFHSFIDAWQNTGK